MNRRMVLVLAAFALLVAACAHEEDSDQLAKARRNLHVAPCGATPAVAGVAGVNAGARDVYLGDWIVVSVCNMETLLKEADAEQQPVTLFVEGLDAGIKPSGLDFDTGTITFIIDRDEQNKKLWQPLLYNPLFDRVVTIRVGAGIHGERPLPRVTGANTTVVLQKIYIDWIVTTWLAVLLIITISLVVWCRNSDMVRDGPAIEGVRQPYSLARSQMAWWLVLILIGYNYIFLVTGDRYIAPSLLALMGISAATAIAAEALPSRDRKGRTSVGFWRDLVTDDRGAVALDRFQIVAWTIVLGGIFLYSVIWDLTMPEFSATMLALMGISSGTYIGFKLPTKADNTPPPPPGGTP